MGRFKNRKWGTFRKGDSLSDIISKVDRAQFDAINYGLRWEERPFLMFRVPVFVDAFLYISFGITSIKAAYILERLIRCYFGFADCKKYIICGQVWYVPISCSGNDYGVHANNDTDIFNVGVLAFKRGLVYMYRVRKQHYALRPTLKFIEAWLDRFDYMLHYELLHRIFGSPKNEIRKIHGFHDNLINFIKL